MIRKNYIGDKPLDPKAGRTIKMPIFKTPTKKEKEKDKDEKKEK